MYRFFAVVRHAERADGPFAFVSGQRWAQSPDSKQWPVDPPLSDEGAESAILLGQRVRDFADQCGGTAHKIVVVTSPYSRCVQTAAAIAQSLGPNSRILVDTCLGEVYGPTVMGSEEPKNAVRPMDNMMLEPQFRRKLASAKLVGEWPAWPEDVRAARQRFALRFLTYLKRASKVQRNFVLVSHGDCVGAALSMMPSYAGQVMERIDYGGMFLAKRRIKTPGMLGGLMQAAAKWSGSTQRTIAEADLDEPPTPGPQIVVLPTEAWAVELWGVVVHCVGPETQAAKKAFTKKIRTVSKGSSFTEKQIEHLLCATLSPNTLGTVNEVERTTDLTSQSDSTLAFGDSVSSNNVLSESQQRAGSLALPFNGVNGDNPHAAIDQDSSDASLKKLTQDIRRARLSGVPGIQQAAVRLVGEEDGPSDVGIGKLRLGALSIDMGANSLLKRRQL